MICFNHFLRSFLLELFWMFCSAACQRKNHIFTKMSQEISDFPCESDNFTCEFGYFENEKKMNGQKEVHLVCVVFFFSFSALLASFTFVRNLLLHSSVEHFCIFSDANGYLSHDNWTFSKVKGFLTFYREFPHRRHRRFHTWMTYPHMWLAVSTCTYASVY